MSRDRTNTAWARAAIDELAGAGVTQIVVAPGSRSTPLVLAASRNPRVRLYSHLDERSAAFMALGIGKATGRPAAILTTSGTAVANLFPAVVEANQSGTPLLLLTADRPARLRGTDSNQTIDQQRIFGSHVRKFVDMGEPQGKVSALHELRGGVREAVSASLARPPGPVHLNFPFEKPLEPPEEFHSEDLLENPDGGDPRASMLEREVEPIYTSDRPLPPSPDSALRPLLLGSKRPVIVCGPAPVPGIGPQSVLARCLAEFAERIHTPLLADPLSGARHGWEATDGIGSYDLFLRVVEVWDLLKPDLIIRVGPAPTSTSLANFLKTNADVPQLLLGLGSRWNDHLFVADYWFPEDPVTLIHSVLESESDSEPNVRTDDGWLSLWQQIERETRTAVSAWTDRVEFEGAILASVVDTVPIGSVLFVSSSMPVRDADSFAPPRAEALPVLGNRGASGIDGIVSTALGVSIAEEGRPVVAAVGDLAFLHDTNGLLPIRRLNADLTIVIIHNDGGGIFHMLPIREYEPDFSPYFTTPHGLDFHHLAELHGLPFQRVGSLDELRDVVAGTTKGCGPRMVEIKTDREENRRLRDVVVDSVREALLPLTLQEL